MFEQAMLSGGPLSTRLLGACAGITSQAALVGATLLVPLLWPNALPHLQSYVLLAAPGPPPAPPPPPGEMTVRPRAIQTAQLRPCAICTPFRIPKGVTLVVDDPPEVGQGAFSSELGVPGSTGTGVPGGLMPDILRSSHWTPPPPPPIATPVKETAPPALQRVRVGGNVKLASPIRRVEPVYPKLAQAARLEGVVILEGVIGIDGRIHELVVKSGHPFFVQAALDAVRQWLYTPGTLNGDPVEVIAPITVTFRLGR